MRTCTALFLCPFVCSLVWSTIALSNEPVTPPDSTKPRQHVVELNEDVVIRMGDSVSLKGGDFSAKLVAFGLATECAMPGQNCGAGYSPDPVPEFLYRQGTLECEPKPKLRSKVIRQDRNCLSQLAYIVTNNHVRDRTAVKVRIVTRTKR